MSEQEPEQKTNPQGDVISTAAPVKVEAGKDPHAEAKKQRVVTPEYFFFEAPRERVFILGFDGMDPDVAERLMTSGKLPNLAWMKEHGAMRRLKTTNPAQSPVAWSAFSTGMNPGKTGIYDFLRRNPDTYYPDFSTVTIQRAKFVLGFLPVRAPSVTNNRKGTTFWSLASSRGTRTAVLEAQPRPGGEPSYPTQRFQILVKRDLPQRQYRPEARECAQLPDEIVPAPVQLGRLRSVTRRGAVKRGCNVGVLEPQAVVPVGRVGLIGEAGPV